MIFSLLSYGYSQKSQAKSKWWGMRKKTLDMLIDISCDIFYASLFWSIIFFFWLSNWYFWSYPCNVLKTTQWLHFTNGEFASITVWLQGALRRREHSPGPLEKRHQLPYGGKAPETILHTHRCEVFPPIHMHLGLMECHSFLWQPSLV